MAEAAGTPPSPASRPSASSSHNSSRRISRTNSNNLSLDLSDLPPLITPSQPSNTLLITNLLDPSIFHPASLATIRENISRTHVLYSFSPLRSFRRIIVSFYTTEAAIEVRQNLDGETILGHRVKIFFGAATPIDADQKDRHLAAPDAGKLFFISPPPSPPHGWEMRNEDPPNKLVHADDLAAALDKLRTKTAPHEEYGMEADTITPISPARSATGDGSSDSRKRSGSTTVVYHPGHHGDSPALPAVMVEDTTGDDGLDAGDKKIMAHTARPPTELMEQ